MIITGDQNLLRLKSRFLEIKYLDFSPFFLFFFFNSESRKSTSSLENIFIIIIEWKTSLFDLMFYMERANKQARPLAKGDHIFHLNDLLVVLLGY